jgi:lipopolysaccharide/colanic/teichoic acid biosynthesis glycosyltransferase
MTERNTDSYLQQVERYLRPGAISLHQARSINSKDDRKRLSYDSFYSKKASFGLDQTILITAAVRRLHGVFDRKKVKHGKVL